MSTVPYAVRKKAEEANKHLAGNTGDPAPQADATPASETPPPEASPQPVEPPASTPSPEPEAPNWQKKYEVLQAKYNAEVPRYAQEVRGLKEQLSAQNNSAELSTLKQQIFDLNAQLNQKTEAAKPVAPELDHLRQQYGEDLVDGLLHHMRSEITPLSSRVESLGKSQSDLAQQAQAQQRNMTLEGILKNNGIDLAIANKDPGFVKWLKEIEPYSGSSRRALLNQAYDGGEMERAAQFFFDYAQQGGSKPPAPKAPSLDKHVQVKPTNTGEPVTQNPAPTLHISTKEFYENKRRGMYTKEEAERLENELFAAMSAAR